MNLSGNQLEKIAQIDQVYSLAEKNKLSALGSNKTAIVLIGSSSIEGYLGNYDSVTLNQLNASGVNMSIPRMLASLVNSDKYEVYNCGVGGEGVPTLYARLGIIPMYNDTDFILPADTSEVVIARYSATTGGKYLKSLYDDSIVCPMEIFNDIDTFNANSFLNPVFINGIECTMKLKDINGIGVYQPGALSIQNNSGRDVFKNGIITLHRNVAATDGVALTIKAGSLITPYAAKLFKSRKVIHIHLVGANGGWYNSADYIAKIKKAVDCYGGSYIVLGYHTSGIFSGYSEGQISQFGISLPNSDAFRIDQKKEFGLNFIDLRKYLSERALFEYCAALNLKITYIAADCSSPNGTYYYTADDISHIPAAYTSYLQELSPASKNAAIFSDVYCMNNALPPTTLMADSVGFNPGSHMNYNGYSIVGKYLYNKLLQIGLITM